MRRIIALLTAVALTAAACGDDTADTAIEFAEMVAAPSTATTQALTTTTAAAPTTATTDVAVTTSTATVERVSAPTTDLVGVYYYPWHGADFHGGDYLRERLVPVQTPELGEYDDRTPAVVGRHLEWSRGAGIDVWVTSWWGPDSREDTTIRTVILPHPEMGPVRIAVLYETSGRTGDFTDMNGIRSDFEYLAREYFGHPNYFTIDGRPAVVVYLTRVLADQGTLTAAVDDMRAGARAEGHDIFVIGDHAFGARRSGTDLAVLDAITNYDVYGAMAVSGTATAADVARYAEDQTGWRDEAAAADVAFVPAATPGFNDTAVRQGHDPLGRTLAGSEDRGSLFRALLKAAIPLRVERAAGLVMVTSWNEWHEDTQIEPVSTAPATTADDSTSGSSLTRGLSYEGYGTRYLDILREILG